VASGNEKIVLGLVWSLILKYELGGERGARQELLAWANAVTRRAPYAMLDAAGFERDFASGDRLLALVQAVAPAAYEYEEARTRWCVGWGSLLLLLL
jgi:hypothetical protein